MKILAIGDFHGKFPKKLQRLSKNVDLIVSDGDYLPWNLAKVFFQLVYGSDIELWEIVGKEKYIESHMKDLDKAGHVLKKLNSAGVPVVTTVGNYDTPDFNDTFDSDSKGLINQSRLFFNLLKKYPNIKRADYRAVKLGKIVIIGAFGHSFPGRVKSKAYKKYKKKLDVLFKRYSRENKEGRVIFVSHNLPYNCGLDVIRDKNALPIVRGKSYGSKLVRRIIDKYQPVLAIAGHIHENQGKKKLGRTLVVNPGPAMEGKSAIISFDEKKGRVTGVKFIGKRSAKQQL